MCKRPCFLILFVLAVVLNIILTAQAQQLAFPGAEGYGAYSTGGRGGDVYHVTSLADDPCTPAPGTLRHGIETAGGTAVSPRTIVFDISGNILLQGVLDFNKSYMTIAGQTAPKGGITLAQRQIQVGSGTYSNPPSTRANPIDTDDIIIRYIRCRLTPAAAPRTLEIYPENEDALRIISCKNTILDHVSTSWGKDEVMSITGRSDNITIQWGLYAEVLNNHPKASLFRPWVDAHVTGHHNLYVNNIARTPRFGKYNDVTARFDWYNNVNYNWGSNNAYSSNNTLCVDDDGFLGNCAPGEHVQINYIKNYMIAGPDSTGPTMPSGPAAGDFSVYHCWNYPNLTEIWPDGNVMDGNVNEVFDGVADAPGDFRHVRDSDYGPIYVKRTSVFPITEPNNIEVAEVALLWVLDEVGSSLYRDTADRRLVRHVYDCNGTNDVVDETVVGGLPVITPVSRAAGFDTDDDGMPDAWEIARELDPDDPNDRNDDRRSDGYTNLEEYLDYIIVIGKKHGGDFENDGDVDMDNLSDFVGTWLDNDCNDIPLGNLNYDCIVDFEDYAIFADNWTD